MSRAIPVQGAKACPGRRLLDFFTRSAVYPHKPPSIRVVPTHSAWVFLAPPFAYKVRKPVDFGFLDFSSLKKRLHFAEREILLNQRLCPWLHLEIVPVHSCGGTWTFKGRGPVVEYAVKMRKLPDRWFIKSLLKRGLVGAAELHRVVETLTPFYRNQRPADAVLEWGRVDHLKISTEENFLQAAAFIGDTLSREALEGIHSYTNTFYQQNKGLFASRRRERRILDCHGDLHLDHIHLAPRRVTIFDCIEFNDRFRCIDVANDVAFLAMDLDYEGRRDLSRYFAGEMAAALGDVDMPALMDFYKCYRAFVRGKVESLHGRAPEAAESERDCSRERAGRYFRLALRYALTGSQPTVIAVMGQVASGKSTLAAGLARELGCSMFSSDQVRKELAGVDPFTRGDAASRRRLYHPGMTRRTYTVLLERAKERLRAGEDVVLDATFGSRKHRAQLRKGVAGVRARLVLVELSATESKTKQRLRQRARTGSVSDARLEDHGLLKQRFEHLDKAERTQSIRVHSSRTVRQTLGRALTSLVQMQFRRTHTPLRPKRREP